MELNNVIFTIVSIFEETSVYGYGGVFYVESLGKLTMHEVNAENILAP